MASMNELIRGSTDLLVLSVLEEGAQYGYAISKIIAARSEGRIKLSAGVLYPLLHQLEQDGLLLSSWDGSRRKNGEDEQQTNGRKRKWYRLSAKGRKRLDKRAAAHRAYQQVLELFLPSGGSGGGGS